VTDFIDYDQIQLDFQAAVEGANLGFESVLLDANDRDYLIDNMPLLDIRFKTMEPQADHQCHLLHGIVMECEVVRLFLYFPREAAKLRGELVNALQRFVKDNPRWSSAARNHNNRARHFGTGESKAEGAFVAGAVLEFHPQLYTE
jgi:hypothetical protein